MVNAAAPRTINRFMLSLASGEQLAQSRPSGTTAVSAFTASLVTEVTLIAICNTTAGAVNYSLYHDDDGSTFDQTTALHYSQSISANSTVYVGAESIGAGIVVKPDGQIGIQTSSANALTFTLYGVTEAVAR